MKISKKTGIIIAVAAVILIVGTIIVFAVLRDTAGTVTETLNKAEVTCAVNDDYTVTNTSNIPVLIRVRVVVNKTDGEEIVPGENTSYIENSDWTKKGNYLYYNGIVSNESGENKTTAPISLVGGITDNNKVLVIAEAIQAASDASKEGWDATYSNGSWS